MIRRLNFGKQTILVTSHFEEEKIKQECQELGVKLIPKNLAGFVPINISTAIPQTKGKPHIPIANEDIPDAILIDDDELVHMNWKMVAKRKNKTIRVFTGPEEFWRDTKTFGKDTPIYVDSNLGNGAKGVDVTWLMGKKGYANLFLATGTNPEQFADMPWLKGIVGKDPPWN